MRCEICEDPKGSYPLPYACHSNNEHNAHRICVSCFVLYGRGRQNDLYVAGPETITEADRVMMVLRWGEM